MGERVGDDDDGIGCVMIAFLEWSSVWHGNDGMERRKPGWGY